MHSIPAGDLGADEMAWSWGTEAGIRSICDFSIGVNELVIVDESEFRSEQKKRMLGLTGFSDMRDIRKEYIMENQKPFWPINLRNIEFKNTLGSFAGNFSMD